LRVKVYTGTQPVAVALIEAKAEHLPPAHGLQQGSAYADSKRLNVPFVFSSNGHLFVEYDRRAGHIGPARPLTEFPTPDELRTRYEAWAGFRLDAPEAAPLLARYPGGEGTRRYYQDAAIRAVLEKLAHCRKQGKPPRALLSLATGAGKTFIATALLQRIAEAGQLRKALFVVDREELRSQAAAALHNAFGANAAVVRAGDAAKNARVLIATYQTLGLDGDADDSDSTATFLTDHYPPDHFSHIILDECHRSAWGRWSPVLTRNPSAAQIGLTATPRELDLGRRTAAATADRQISADNIAYFGEPVYRYDMAQGIEDGYLAACEVVPGRVNVDATGLSSEEILARRPTNARTGAPMLREELREYYAEGHFEDTLLLPDRVQAMCLDLFQFLLETGGPEQKTIIFCVRDHHADAVAIALNNRYADWCAEQGMERAELYAFKCTAASGGNDYLADLRGSARSHFIAATVDLLTTGVDVPVVRNIIFFRYVQSPIAFYQMVGRGTRLDPPSGKLAFRVYDYTNATRLFGAAFVTKFKAPPQPKPDQAESSARPAEPIVQVEGIEVRISHAGKYIVTMVDGKAMPVTVEAYKARLAETLVAEAPTLDEFRQQWVTPSARQALLAHLPDGGRSAQVVRAVDERADYDLYDILAELGYGQAPHTRLQRAAAFSYKHASWLNSLPGSARATLNALATQVAMAGTDGLENPAVFQTPEVVRAGGLAALGVLGRPAEVLRQAKERIFAP
jgi:type I restriction enzyme R subunit